MPQVGAPLRSWCGRIALAVASVSLAYAIVTAGVAMTWRVGLLGAAALGALGLAFRYVPAFDPLGRVRWRLPLTDGRKSCALTFDDGPTAATGAVLDILAAEQIPATFFVIGANVERHPALVRRAQAEGHAVGIHGMTHARLASAPASMIAGQVDGVSDALSRAGVTHARVYRTPHGIKSPRVFEVARRRGLTLWAWSRGVWDTDRPAPDLIVRRATRGARAGMVLLLHDGRGDEAEPDTSAMVAALPRIVRELKRRGFAFVRLADV